MSARTFWRTTPRKFTALCEVHADLNDPDAKKNGGRNSKQTVYVDQLSYM